LGILGCRFEIQDTEYIDAPKTNIKKANIEAADIETADTSRRLDPRPVALRLTG